MTKYQVVKYNGGGWTTIATFDNQEDAEEKYKTEKNDKDLIGLMACPARGMAYMLERSDW